MESRLGSFIKLYTFPTGRRLFAVHQVKQRAQKRGEGEIAGLCDEALAVDGETISLERQWNVARRVTEGTRSDAAAVDIKVDRAIGAWAANLQSEASVFAGSKRGDAAEKVLGQLFPDGVTPIIHASHENELAMVDEMVAAARGELAGEVETLGMNHYVDHLAVLADEFRVALGRVSRRAVTFDQVREARGRGQEAMLRVFAVILGRFGSPSESDTAARVDLLGPILKQDRRIGEFHRRRRTVQDVDEKTGEETVDQADADTLAGESDLETLR